MNPEIIKTLTSKIIDTEIVEAITKIEEDILSKYETIKDSLGYEHFRTYEVLSYWEMLLAIELLFKGHSILLETIMKRINLTYTEIIKEDKQ